MSAEYTVSFAIHLSLTHNEERWWRQAAKLPKSQTRGGALSTARKELQHILKEQGGYGFHFEFRRDEDTTPLLLLYSVGESGNVDALGQVLRVFLQHMRPTGNDVIVVPYAVACTEPEPGEFGGNTVVITRKDLYWGRPSAARLVARATKELNRTGP